MRRPVCSLQFVRSCSKDQPKDPRSSRSSRRQRDPALLKPPDPLRPDRSRGRQFGPPSTGFDGCGRVLVDELPTELTVDVVGIATAEAAHPRREDLDPLWGDVVLERAAATRVRTRRGFNALHNDAIVAGLQRREGSWLVPALVVDADKQLADYVLFQSMFVIGRAVGRDEERQLPEEIRICRGCTLVFRPTRSDQMA